MRLVIVGLDGLDPNLVKQWKMDWFKQRSWGRHYVGLLNDLYTPILWSCFLTGMNVEEYGYSLSELRERRDRSAFKSKFIYKLYLLRKKLPIKKLGLRKLLISRGLLEPHPPSIMPEHLLKRTFLEELKAKGYRVVAIEVPGYNETKNEYYRSEVKELITAPFHERAKIVEEALEDTRQRASKATECVRQNYDIVFVYSPLPDIAFHLATKPNLNVKAWLRTVHYSLYKTIKELLDLAEEKGYAVLMASDHGFDLNSYYHSEHGFWSLNVEPPTWWSINSILDFNRNILKLVMG